MRNRSTFPETFPPAAPVGGSWSDPVAAALTGRASAPKGAAGRTDDALRDRAAAAARSGAEAAALGTIAGGMVLGALYPTIVRAMEPDEVKGGRAGASGADEADKADASAADERAAAADAQRAEASPDGAGPQDAGEAPSVEAVAASVDAPAGHERPVEASAIPNRAPSPERGDSAADQSQPQAAYQAVPAGPPAASGLQGADAGDLVSSQSTPALQQIATQALQASGPADPIEGSIPGAAAELVAQTSAVPVDTLASLGERVVDPAVDGVAALTDGTVVQSVASLLVDVSALAPRALNAPTSSASNPAVPVLSAASEGVVQPVASVLGGVAEGVASLDPQEGAGAVTEISATATGIVGSAADATGDVVHSAPDAINAAPALVAGVAETVSSAPAATEAVSAAGKLAGAALPTLTDTVAKGGEALGTIGETATKGTGETLGEALGSVSSTVGDTLGSVANGSSSETPSKGGVSDTGSAVRETVDDAVTRPTQAPSTDKGAIASVSDTLLGKGAGSGARSDSGSKTEEAKHSADDGDPVRLPETGSASDAVSQVTDKVGSAVGGAIDLRSASTDAARASDRSDMSDRGGGEGASSHSGDGGSAPILVEVAADIVQAPTPHVGFTGQSYVDTADAHEHGLSSGNGLLHGLV